MTAGAGGPGSPGGSVAAGRTGVVVQVRLGSTRLPGKALLPMGGATMTDMVLERLSLVPAAAYILATDAASAEALGPIAERHAFDLVVGPEEDVLERYAIAVRRFGLRKVVRATGDNPLVSPELAALLLERGQGRPADYAAFTGMPLGMGVELVDAGALLRAASEAREPREREHVCPYLYGHPELFSIDRAEAPDFLMPEGRVTVDTREDYEAALMVYGALYDGSQPATAEVLRFLRARAAQAGGPLAAAGEPKCAGREGARP